VKELTAGRLVIEAFGSGMIVGPKEMFDAVSNKVFEAAQGSPAYWTGKEAGWKVLRGAPPPFFTAYWQLDAWLWTGGGLDITRDLYADVGNLHFVTFTLRPGESLHFKEKVTSIAEYKGTKQRTITGPTAALFEGLGGSPVFLGSGEIYTSLDKGLLDAAEWMGLGDNYGLGMHEVTDYFMAPSFHSPIGVDDFFVGMQAWEALPADLQAILESAVHEWSSIQYYTMAVEDASAVEKYIAAGNEQVSWSEEDWKTISEISADIWAETSQESPAAIAIYESQKAFFALLGL
jgi:TRAP-type mannitol/chloroaromatic compound transport system substrate-binding protein